MNIVNNIPQVINDFKSGVSSNINNIGEAVLSDMKNATPVLTGNLKNSESYNISQDGNKYTLYIGVGDVPYAAKVEFENKSYIRYALQKNKDKVQSLVNQGVLGGLGRWI